MKKEHSFIWQLFWVTFQLSAFTFGGGYIIVSLMKKKMVDHLKWISEDEMLNLIAIAQSAPGPVAVNSAIMVGYQMAGYIGIITCVVATVSPPLLVISFISLFYEAFIQNIWVATLLEGMQAGVAAVIVMVTWEMASGIVKGHKPFFNGIMVIAFIANYFFHISVMVLILLCIITGLIYSFFLKNESKSLKNELKSGSRKEVEK